MVNLIAAAILLDHLMLNELIGSCGNIGDFQTGTAADFCVAQVMCVRVDGPSQSKGILRQDAANQVPFFTHKHSPILWAQQEAGPAAKQPQSDKSENGSSGICPFTFDAIIKKRICPIKVPVSGGLSPFSKQRPSE